ncbi:hypothetical protein [Sporosarcina aquimarina]|nr:hypothetical protein [Sporosarcina aquimarina]
MKHFLWIYGFSFSSPSVLVEESYATHSPLIAAEDGDSGGISAG